MIGTVKKWQGTYGFITSAGGDYFVHYTGIVAEPGVHRSLTVGEDVDFNVEKSDRGPKAVDVKRLSLEGLPADADDDLWAPGEQG